LTQISKSNRAYPVLANIDLGYKDYFVVNLTEENDWTSVLIREKY
jgi:hypothetical protein